MVKFSEHDLDRSWSPNEVGGLSDRELTILAYRRDRKNVLFFFPQAIILYFAIDYLGVFGQALGWIAVVLFGCFALNSIFVFIVGIFVLITNQFVKDVPERSTFIWKLFAVLLSFANAAIYSLAVAIVCAGIYQWNF